MEGKENRLSKGTFSVTTVLYYAGLFFLIVSRLIDLISFSTELLYPAMMLSRYLKMLLIWFVFIHLCISAGSALGVEFLKIERRNAAIRSCLILIRTGVMFWLLLTKIPGFRTEPFYMVLSTYLVVLSSGKRFESIVKAFVIAYAAILMTALLGQIFGFTLDNVKNMSYGAKHSLGMVHPNTAAHVILMIVTGIWLLYLHGKKKETFLLFAGAATVISLWIHCRTVIIALILMAVLLLLEERWKAENRKIVKYIVAASPLFCFLVTLVLCIPIDLMHHLTYHNMLFSIGERFVQSGIAIREYGLPFIGHAIDTSGAIRMMVDGEKIRLFVMDNAFVSYGVILGLIWLIPSLTWLCTANLKAWNSKKYELIVYGLVMSVFAILERRGLDPAFNLMFFYPLTFHKTKG